MYNVLLVVTFVISLVAMICSLITVIIVTKDSKEKDLVKKVLTRVGIVFAVIVILGAAIGVSMIKKDEGTSSNNTTSSTESSALQSAGFNEVSLDEYLKLIEKDENSIILVARPTCGYCEKFTPILKQAMEDMNLKINYIDTDKLSNDDWTTFTSSLNYLNSEEWGTPLVLIVKNKEVVAENSGYVELETIKEFFKNNGFGE